MNRARRDTCRAGNTVLAVVLGGILLWVSQAPAAGRSSKVLVGFRGRPNRAVVEAVGGRVKYVYDLVPAIAAEVPDSMIRVLRGHRRVLYVEPDFPVYATSIRAEPFAIRGVAGAPQFSPGLEVLPWGIERIGAPAVWLGLGGTAPPNMGEGVKVGIIDTGIDYTHPDLADNYVLGYDFVNGDWDPMDDNGHGTHVAGIIAALDDGPNSGGGNTTDVSVVGAAPKVSLYIAKSLNREGAGSMSDVVAALNVAANYDVDIVNMSLGSPFFSRTLKRACQNAYRSGVLLVAAAGNEGLSSVDIPARYSSVIAVAAANEWDEQASFSNSGRQIELSAPGVSVLSTMPTYTVRLNESPYGCEQVYDYLSGTSMACPHVTASAALAWAAHPGWANSEVRSCLAATADDLGDAGRDKVFGYGLVNAAAAAAY